MIRSIVAIDSNRGMADDNGIPWDLPSGRRYYVDQTKSGLILMGYGTYLELSEPFHGAPNYVATSKPEALREGFIAVHDVQKFLDEVGSDVWNIGGPNLLVSTLGLVDELYVTQLDGDFHCTKFLPEFKDKFELVSQTQPRVENGIRFRFEVWRNLHKQG